MLKKLMIGLTVLSLSACATTRQPSAPTGDSSYFIDRWDSAAELHSNEPAPKWSKKEYAELLKAYEISKSENKESKVK